MAQRQFVNCYTNELSAGTNMDEIDVIHWGYVEPNSVTDWNLTFASGHTEAGLDYVINQVHAAGKLVKLHIYGNWAWYATGGNQLFYNTTYQDTFFASIATIKTNHPGLDGIYFAPEFSERLLDPPAWTSFMTRMYAALNPLGLTTTLGLTWRWSEVNTGVLPYIDAIVVKVYDLDQNPPTMEWYGTLANFQASVGYYVAAGIPKNKLVGACQIGAYTWTGSYYTWSQSYKWIVDNYDPAPSLNLVGTINTVGSYKYQGLDLVKSKAQWIKDNNYDGVMIYNLGMDKLADPRSMITNVWNILKTATPDPGSGVFSGTPAAQYDCYSVWRQP